MPRKTARIKPVRKERRPVKPAHKEPKQDLHAENEALRTVLEHAARFLLVRDQASADALRAGLIAHHIIKE